MAGQQLDREELIRRFMENHNMSRKDAEFAADIELGELPRGDLIEVEDDSSE